MADDLKCANCGKAINFHWHDELYVCLAALSAALSAPLPLPTPEDTPDAVDHERLGGVFEYLPAGNGWRDSFRLVDDDGMAFALDHLRRFSGHEVVLTITRRPPQHPETA